MRSTWKLPKLANLMIKEMLVNSQLILKIFTVEF